eukprot:403364445
MYQQFIIYDEKKQKEQSQVIIEEEFIRQKKQLNEVRELLDKLSTENERFREDNERKERIIEEMQIEKDERVKRHLQEIENIKLAHQQELYMLKRMMK